jgi:predicted polyphosphate/ATP-dependent NAD kinase
MDFLITGMLEVEKCFSYIMHWEFDDEGNARLATPDELADTIKIQQSEDIKEVEIRHKDCKTVHRTLGVMTNVLGTQEAEADRLIEKGKKIDT